MKQQFRAITFTLAQYRVIRRAIDLVRDMEEDRGIPKGRALELICGDFLAGPYRKTKFQDQPKDPWQ